MIQSLFAGSSRNGTFRCGRANGARPTGKTNTYQIEHYLISQFGDFPLRKLDTFRDSGLAEWPGRQGYSQVVVRSCFIEHPRDHRNGQETEVPYGRPWRRRDDASDQAGEKPVMTREQILALIGGIEDVHDLCLLHVGIFCGPRASEVMGLQWKSWTGEALVPHGTAYEGQFYSGRLKTKQSKAPIPVPEQVRPVIEAWRRVCKDSHLMP